MGVSVHASSASALRSSRPPRRRLRASGCTGVGRRTSGGTTPTSGCAPAAYQWSLQSGTGFAGPQVGRDPTDISPDYVFQSKGRLTEWGYEVEITVAQVGTDPAADQLYRLTYDGSVTDEPGLVAMGGAAEALTAALSKGLDASAELATVLRRAVEELGRAGGRELGAGDLEVALLDRFRPRRAFSRVPVTEVEAHLAPAGEA